MEIIKQFSLRIWQIFSLEIEIIIKEEVTFTKIKCYRKNESLGLTSLEKPTKSRSINAQNLSVYLPRTININFVCRREKFSLFEKKFLQGGPKQFFS